MASSNTLPYIGSKISLISNAGIRYEGILYNINTAESTVGLSNVRTFGTEGRKLGSGVEIPPGDEIYDFIVFRGRDIKDLTVSEPLPPDDPAIVAINPGPPVQPPTTSGSIANNRMHEPQMIHMGQQRHGGGMSGNQMNNPNTYMLNQPRINHYNNNGIPRDNMFVNLGVPGNRDDYNQNRIDTRRQENYHNQNMYVNNRRGGTNNYSNRGRGNYNFHRIVGELTPQPNQTLKSLVEEAFNFEEANLKFDKNIIENECNSTTEGKENDIQDVKTTNSGPIVKNVYDKKLSFFDNISCETLDRQFGVDARVDRTKQRQLDVETFGASAAHIRSERGNRLQHRGMGGYRRQMNNGPTANTNHPGGGRFHFMQGNLKGYQHNYESRF